MADSRKQGNAGPPFTTMPAAWWQSPGVILAGGAALVGLIIAGESVVALAIVLMEGSVALAALASAALAGGWIMHLLGLGPRPWRDRLVMGAGLGVGSLSLIVLGLGSAGALSRLVAIALVAVLVVAGLARLVLDLRKLGHLKPRGLTLDKRRGLAALERDAFVVCQGLKPAAPCAQNAGGGRRTIRGLHWLWLAVCPFLAVALLAACLPPGVLWEEEAFGYDVLEYHLAVPKAFLAEGGIAFLPYNVYSNFPLNSEMLSLLMMTLRGDAMEASFMATMVNVALGGLFVAAAWLAGCTFSPRVGVLAGVLAGVLPWTAYLAGIAYVEVGMLAMGMCSLAAILKAKQRPDSSHRWLLAAGLLAGLASGFKYTAVPLIALPAAVLSLLVRAHWRKRLAGLLLFSVGAAAAFAPWMIRNVVNTGNPVFPLAYSVFAAKPGVWDDELEARWQRAHGPEAAELDKSTGQRLFSRTIGDFRMGGVLFVLAAAGAVMRRDRWTIALAAMLVWQVTVWLTATHHFARFAVVMVLPLILLAARTLESSRFPALARLVCTLLIAGAGWNLYRLGGLYYDHTCIAGRPINAYGRTDAFVQGPLAPPPVGAINALGAEARVMLVGEARSFYIQPRCDYAVVFNHHPLADAVRRLPDAQAVLQWLRNRGTTHVLVHWAEMERLRGTYGFYPELDAVLFARLVQAGLIESASFRLKDEWPYATLFEVAPNE